MGSQITRQFDHEEGKRRDKARKNDYRDVLKEEGDTFDRGGIAPPKLVTFHKKGMTLHLGAMYADDKQSMVRTLKTWRFAFDGKAGTITQLLKDPKISEKVAARFEMTKRSIFTAQKIVGSAGHPKKGRDYPLVQFKCFLVPDPPKLGVVFKYVLAFQAVVVQSPAA